MSLHDTLSTADEFVPRHIGPRELDEIAMLNLLGYESLDAMTAERGLSEVPALAAEILEGRVRGRTVIDVSA